MKMPEGISLPKAEAVAVIAAGIFLMIEKKDVQETKSGRGVRVCDDKQKKHNSRAVKKTLSIPAWLNEEATEMGVNFSQVRQEALKEKINAGK